MEAALALAELARLIAPPNPWVGCVLVRDGQVVGEGHTLEPGSAHAEVNALAAAGAAARGATAYTTLEPCSHHGRTPPCVDALVGAGVSRVVTAIFDPDPRVSGNGVARLRDAGVAVEHGLMAQEVRRQLRPYLHQRSTGRAFALLKAAASLDGRTAAADGTSRWITGPDARRDAHRLRAESGAVLVGAGTALADRPSLTVRHGQARPPRPPLRVLLDSSGRVPASGALFDRSLAPTLVFTSARSSATARHAWEAAGAEVFVAPERDAGVDLAVVLRALAERGVLQVLVEGGAFVHGSFLRSGYADGLALYVGNAVLGASGAPLFAGFEVAGMDRAPRWRVSGAERMHDDGRVDSEPAAAAPPRE
ncbi:MAG: bifunctional diaminohydroxyphosphoribosylaminopyrimidine deaminase/5-amino-6-(5-phosphoribosylamino)uracil reductase RibD [Chloroflexi bacterium]|nr:bifunctional diaminohydroxyphosphoribosylaminopyrimidine deaminase/5-amino-6-(5-phosphoribosylamino)uracil reductase RibD [Chloroflexota bacterium]